jgi:hypothetical protein
MIKRFIIACFFCYQTSEAQNIPEEKEAQVEELARVTESESVEDQGWERLLEVFRKEPLSLNTGSAESLRSLGILTDLQVENIIRYRQLMGPLISLYELQAIPSLDLATIKKLLPYVSIHLKQEFQEKLESRLKGGEQQVLIRASRVMERSKGYAYSLLNGYAGDPNHLMLQYRYHYKNLLQFGMTADKDAGETFFGKHQKRGFDFYSGYFFARDLGRFKAIALGDFTVNLGQGLIQWQTMAFNRSPEVMFIKRQANVLLPYHSSGEAIFHRGFGMTIPVKNFEITAFVSRKKIDVQLNEDSTQFTSLLSSGLHRTASEVQDRHNATLFSTGGNIKWKHGSGHIGASVLAHQFSATLQKREEPYNLFSMKGDDLLNLGIDYSYTHRNIHFFGEAAIDKNIQPAMVTGCLISLDPKLDLSLLYRNIHFGYSTLWGNSFTENTSPVNEKGFYAGLALRLHPNWQLNAYVDVFQFPWIRARADAPGSGFEQMLHIRYRPSRKFEMMFRYRDHRRPVNGQAKVMRQQDLSGNKNIRVHFTQAHSRKFQLKGRMEYTWFTQGPARQEGFLSFIEGAYAAGMRLKFNLRLQCFETEDFDSRLYAYESDVPFSFSAPAFSGKGFRYYFNLGWDLTRKINCWLKWSQTFYRDGLFRGSGLDQISGSTRSAVRLQVRIIM